MRIPTREEQARYGNLNAHDTQRFNVQERTPDMKLQINADMLGAGQAKALGEASRDLKQLGYVGAKWYVQDQDVKGEDQYNKLLQEANEGLYGKEGILMQKGEAGKDAASKAKEFLTSLSDKYSKNLSDAAHNSFMDRTQRFATHTMTRAQVHAAEEDRANTINIREASMASAKDNALRNAANPEAFNDYAAQYMQALTLRDQVQGLPQEKIDMNRKVGLSGLYMDKVQGLIVGGDLKGAKAAVNSGGLMEQDRIKALGVINQEQKRLQAEARANAAEATYNKAETLANGLYGSVENGELSNAEALLQIRNIKDPKLQAHARSSYMQRLQIAEISRKETVARGYEKGADDFDRTGNNMQEQYDLVQNASRAALLPGATEEQKSYARSLKEQYKMSTQFAEDGIRTGSNPAAYDAVTNLVYGGADVSDLKKTEYWSQLSPTAKRTFEKSVKEGQQASLSELTRLYNESYRTAEGTEYTAKNGNGDREIFIQRSLEKIRDTKRGNEPKYLQSLVDEHFMEATNPGGKIWDTSGKYGQLSRTEGGALPIMSEADRQQVEVVFNSNPQVKKAWMDYAKKTWGEANANYAMRAYLLQQKLKITGKRGQ